MDQLIPLIPTTDATEESKNNVVVVGQDSKKYGTVTVNTELTADEFERQRRLEMKQLKHVYPKNSNAAGPTAEQAALFSERRHSATTKPTNAVKPGEERSILHCKTDDYMRIPDSAPDAYKYYRHKDTADTITSHLPKGQCKFTLSGHYKPVTSICMPRNVPHLLLSASADGRAKLWSVLTGQPLRTFIGHSTGIRQIVSDNDTTFLTLSTATSPNQHQIRLWDLESGKCLTALHLKRAPTVATFFHSSKRVLIGQENGEIQLWDIYNQTLVRQFTANSAGGAVRCLALLEGSHFVSGGDDRVVRLWNSYDSVPLQQVGKPDVCDIYCHSAVHPTNTEIVFSSLTSPSDMHLFTFDPQQRQLKMRSRKLIMKPADTTTTTTTTDNHYQVPPKACFSPDGRFLAGTDRHGSVHFWDWTSGQPAKRLEAGSEPICDVLFSPADPSLFVTAGVDRTVRLWS